MELGQIHKNRIEIDSGVGPLVKRWVLVSVLWTLAGLVTLGASMLELLNPDRFVWSGVSFGKLFPLAKFILCFGGLGSAAWGASVWSLARESEDRPSVGLLGRWANELGFGFWSVGVLSVIAYVVAVGLPGSGVVPQGSLWLLSLGALLSVSGMLSFGGLALGSTQGFGLSLVCSLVSLCSLVAYIRGSSSLGLLLGIVCASMLVVGSQGLSASVLAVCAGVVGVVGALCIKLVVVGGDAKGVVTAVSDAWFSGVVLNAFGLLIPVGVAVFVLGKSTGRPLFSRGHGVLIAGLAGIFGGLVGLASFSDGPVPAWVGALGSGSVFFVMVVVLGFSSAVFRQSDVPAGSPSVAFVRWGSVMLVTAGLLRTLLVIPEVAESSQLTIAQIGVDFLQYFVGGGLVIWGSIYYIYPRVCGCEWLSSSLISWHLRGMLYGGGLAFGCMFVSGVASGSALNEALAPFSESVAMGRSYYWGTVIGIVLMVFGQMSSLLNVGFLSIRIGQPAGEATLLPDVSNH